MRAEWAIVCRSCAVDRDSNSLSLFEIVEELTVATAPSYKPGDTVTVPSDFCIAALVARSGSEPENATVKIVFEAPGHKEMVGSMSVDLTSHERYRLIARMQGFRFSGPGTYSLQFVDGSENVVAKATFAVRVGSVRPGAI